MAAFFVSGPLDRNLQTVDAVTVHVPRMINVIILNIPVSSCRAGVDSRTEGLGETIRKKNGYGYDDSFIVTTKLF